MNIATHKQNGLIKRHSRREALCVNVAARGKEGLRATDIVALDAFRQAQAEEIRTQVNNAIDAGLITATLENGAELHRLRESDNANRVRLHITALGETELTTPAKARPVARMAFITQPRRQPITGVPNPLDRPPHHPPRRRRPPPAPEPRRQPPHHLRPTPLRTP